MSPGFPQHFLFFLKNVYPDSLPPSTCECFVRQFKLANFKGFFFKDFFFQFSIDLCVNQKCYLNGTLFPPIDDLDLSFTTATKWADENMNPSTIFSHSFLLNDGHLTKYKHFSAPILLQLSVKSYLDFDFFPKCTFWFYRIFFLFRPFACPSVFDRNIMPIFSLEFLRVCLRVLWCVCACVCCVCAILECVMSWEINKSIRK